MMSALAEIEVQRVRSLVSAVERGEEIRPLRDPVPGPDVPYLLRRAGLKEWVERLDEDTTDLKK